MKRPYTREEVAKGLRVTEYFYNQYGEEHCKFILSRIGSAIQGYSESDIKSMGDKIALFNGWATLEELQKKGI